MSDQDVDWTSPLVRRYAGRDMAALFGPHARARAWRDVWIALAEAEQELGAPVSPEQVAALRETADQIDLARVAEIEAVTRHDVMAHVRAWGEVCPEGAPVIHLGATSCFVTDNADNLIQLRALRQIRSRLVRLVRALAALAEREAERPTLGYTHFQPAQPVTAGKRAALWLQDAVWDLEEVERRLSGFTCRGAKGTTGTQASFLALFGGDPEQVRALDRKVAEKLGFAASVALAAQTAPRKLEAQLGDTLAGVGVTLGKLGRDVRLLCHTGELREAFGKGQVGSSAMPYKRNPMKAERICALARLLSHQRAVLAETAAVQWLERSLDDSAARRLVLPDMFLTADGVLRAAADLVRGLEVDLPVVEARLAREAPFLAVEKLLVRGVAAGGDRQELHEVLREHAVRSRPAADPGAAFRAAVCADERFDLDEAAFDALCAPAELVGMAPLQVRSYLSEVVAPVLERSKDVDESEDPLQV
ncbi:MAG TPA: adenylosuccinate lyase [Planctomycetes bacterium]|nr:adenylosuccinate lyase [Planctomycetota bacterium]